MTLDTALFFVGLVAEASVFGLLLFRRIYKSLPVFSAFLAWSLLNDISVFLLLQRLPEIGRRVYLASAFVDAAFMFSILIEILMSVLRPIRNSLPRWTVFAVAALVASLCGVVWIFAKPEYSAVPLRALTFHVQLTTSVVRVLFFVALAGLSQLFSLGFRDRELQIATGFGIYSFASLVVALVHQNPALASSQVMPPFHVLEQIASASYVLSMVYWAFSFAQSVPERREFTPQMQNFLVALAGNARNTRMAMTGSNNPKSGKRVRR